MDEDAVLLGKWRDGDEHAGQVLFRRYYMRLDRFFEYKKIGEDNEELVQKTFLGCVTGRERIRCDTSFRAYLFGVANRVLLRHLRDRYRCREEELTSRSIHDLAPSPVSVVAARQEQTKLLLALRRLPLQMQILIELHYWQDLSSTEIQQALGMPAATVRGWIMRARAKLQEAMTQEAVQAELADRSLENLDRWTEELRVHEAYASVAR